MPRPDRPPSKAPAIRSAAQPPRAGAPPLPLLPPWSAWFEPRAPFLVPLILLAMARGVYAWRIPLAGEDAYITFRYARELVAGHGLVFNLGERVMGFTSPLWTLWTALGVRLIGDPMVWTRLSSILADIVTLLLVTALLDRTISRASAWVFGVFFALWPFFNAVAVSSMENGAVLSLVVLSAALARRGSRLSGPALVALALSRPEGFAAACLLGIAARPRDRLIALAGTLVGLGALYAYYGTVIPQSVLAKAAIYGTPGPWAGRSWWDWFIPMPLGRAPAALEGVHLFIFSVVLAPAVVVGGVTLWAQRNSPLALAAAVGVLVWMTYSLLGVAYFYWYLVLPLGGLLILAAVGFPKLVRGPGVYVSATFFVAGMWFWAQSLYIGRAQNEYFLFGHTAKYLVENSQPGQTVMLEPIGMVGYFTGLRIVDEVGLVSPGVSRRRLQGPGWFTDVVREERPDWLVARRFELTSLEAFAGVGAPFRSQAERDSVLAGYPPATTIEEQRGEQAMVIMRRR